MRRRFVQMGTELVEVPRDWRPEPQAQYHIVGDIQPYESQIDGSMIGSRAQHREHLKAHNCIEVGNDSSLQRTQRLPHQSPPGLKEAIARQVYSKLRY